MVKRIIIIDIMEKYPDMIVDVHKENKDAVLTLDAMRIKFHNTIISQNKSK